MNAKADNPAGGALPDVLAPGLTVLFVGINPGRQSAAARAHYANPRNAFWRCLHAAGLTPTLLRPDQQGLLPSLGLGLTNAVARTTPGSGDLRARDWQGALQRLEELAHTLLPAWIAFVGKDAYTPLFTPRARVRLGVQRRPLGPSRVFVLPSTSPANAVLSERQKAAWFRRLARRLGT